MFYSATHLLVKNGSAGCLEFIIDNVLCYMLAELAGWDYREMWKTAQMSEQIRHQQLHITFGSRSTASYIPDITLHTLSFFFFFKAPPLLSAGVSLTSWWMKQRQARRWRSRGAGLRCEQVWGFTAVQEWEQFQVHSCGVWFTIAHTPSLPACVEILSPWEDGRGEQGGASW